jgi:long-chain acyl-CoA synthetase
MYMTQSLRRAAQNGGERIATIDGIDRRSWLETSWRVQRLAGGLAALDVKAGHRVAVLSYNSARYLESYFAIFWLGAVCVPLNTRWSLEELVYGLTDSTPEVLLVDGAFVGMASDLCKRCPSIRHVILTAGDASIDRSVIDYETLLARSDPADAASVAGDALALICYTGGTTGRSKGVMLSHLNLWSGALAFGHDVQDLASRETVMLNVMPLFHIGGTVLMLATVLGGGCNVFMANFEPRAVLGVMQNDKITHVLLAPTMVRMILDQPDIRKFDLSCLKTLGYGGGPMSQAQIEEAMQKLPGIRLFQGYGQTELSPYVSILRPENHALDGPGSGKLRSVGRLGICSDGIIADPSGKELPRGEIGELLVRGPHTMQGYWNKPAETAAALVNGWVRTGDAGYVDDDGFIFLVDRMKDMIVSGGEKIYSSEVENALASHPAVATGVVIGIPDEKWGEAVHAIIVLKDGYHPTADDIIAHCRALIAGYKCPRSVEFRTEPLPLASLGKVLKRELREPYWSGRDSSLV